MLIDILATSLSLFRGNKLFSVYYRTDYRSVIIFTGSPSSAAVLTSKINDSIINTMIVFCSSSLNFNRFLAAVITLNCNQSKSQQIPPYLVTIMISKIN